MTPTPAAPSALDLQRFDALRAFMKQWTAKLQLGEDLKRSWFGRNAKTGMDYYQGPHNFIFNQSGAKDAVGFTYHTAEDEPFRAPVFQMTFNKVAEMVQIFGPILYHRNPERVVNPRKDWKPPDLLLTGFPPPAAQQPQQPGQPPDPSLAAYMQQMQQAQQVRQQLQYEEALLQARASLLEQYLNYTPNELGLKEEMRLVVDEALIKGRSCLWTELYTPPGGQYKFVGSFYDSVDNLVVDPDATRLDDAKWIARRCIHPSWEVERTYGLPPGSLRSRVVGESSEAKSFAVAHDQGEQDRKTGRTADLVTYFKVWSKMGLGARLRGGIQGLSYQDPLRQLAEAFGDYVYLVVVPDIPFPINAPPDLCQLVFGNASLDQMTQNPLAARQIMAAAQQLAPKLRWPIPFWVLVDDGWPVSCLDFHAIPGKPWPMSHLTPAMGEQNFLDWAYSFLAGHVRNACRDFVCINKGASEEIKTAIEQGRDLSILEVDPINQSISEAVQFLQHPTMNKDLLPVIENIERNFERRTGLSEMMYGETATQSRSATDAQAKTSSTQIRPDDMAERVEQVATMSARKEGIACRLMLTGQDIAPILGNYAAAYWDQYVASQDLAMVAREFDFRVEAFGARKPNKDRDVDNTSQGLQTIFPILSQWAQRTGDMGPMNAFLTAWAKARDFDVEPFLIDPQKAQAWFQQQQQAQQQAQQQKQQQAQPQQQQQPAQPQQQ